MTKLDTQQRRLLWLYLCTLVGIAAFEWIAVAVHWHSVGSQALSDSPLDRWDQPFTDWSHFISRVSSYGARDTLTNPQYGIPYPYPAPSFYFFLLYIRLFRDSTLAYVWSAVAIFAAMFACFSFACWRRTHSALVQGVIWSTLFLGFPTLFLIDRGNIEAVVWLIVSLGVAAFVFRWHATAAALIGLAASIKIYPAVLLLLFLGRRKYGHLVFGAVFALFVSLIALRALGPDLRVTMHGMQLSGHFLRIWQVGVTLEDILRFDHSLFGFYKQAKYAFYHLHYGIAENQMTYFGDIRPYGIVAAIGFIGVYWFRLRKLPLLNQYVCLTIAAILLPYVSYEYTLVQMYSPLAALLIYFVGDGERPTPAFSTNAARLVAVLFAIVFAPLYLLCFRHFDGQVKAIVLVLLFGLFAARPLPSQLFGDASTATA